MSRPIRQELARRLSPVDNRTAKQPKQTFPGGLGTVSALNMDGSIGVVYNGAPIPCQPVAGYVASIGDRVLVVVVGTINFAWSVVKTTPWAPLAALYNSGWSDNTGGNPLGSWRRVGDEVELRGNILGGSGTICTLPPAAVPTGVRQLLTTGGSFSACCIHVDASGDLIFDSGDSAAVWLDNIRYSID